MANSQGSIRRFLGDEPLERSTDHIVAVSEPLKGPGSVEDNEDERCGSSKVAFQPLVSVRLIASREEHSEDTKALLWSNRKEIAVMAARNMLEFAAEGWDWRNVIEDEALEVVGGKLVHPIHTNPLLSAALRRRIPYPRAVTPPDEDYMDYHEHNDDDDDEEKDRVAWYYEHGATMPLDALIDRPSSPSPENPFGDCYDEDDDDDNDEESGGDEDQTHRYHHTGSQVDYYYNKSLHQHAPPPPMDEVFIFQPM